MRRTGNQRGTCADELRLRTSSSTARVPRRCALAAVTPSVATLKTLTHRADAFPVRQAGSVRAHSQAGRGMRTREEVEPFFEGLELVEPGLVTAPEWYREEPAPVYGRSGFYVGVARVP
ncbi:SAM-dependent methyltransferase [Streptomyces sp. NPDC051020]|uniref:SAM-dependent methyltransferase n=1 Tax=Streptomyces sp. NPDC051020 TaxID=3155409 RepID=UPI00344A294E